MESLNLPSSFHSVTICITVIDEVDSLEKTIECIASSCDSKDIEEVLIVTAKHTKQRSLDMANLLIEKFPSLNLKIFNQQLPYIGGAIRDAFTIAKGCHFIIMASDLETDPLTVQKMIEQSKINPKAIITASRWLYPKCFIGYHPVKKICNYLFQRVFSLLYRVPSSDLSFGFRLIPTYLLQNIHWQELKHPLLLESILKPIRLKITIIEVASVWRARSEGVSHLNFFTNFSYILIGIKVLFLSRKKILKPQVD